MNENKTIELKNIKEIENIKKEENFLAILNCGHIFHSACIVDWMKNHDNCPICRKKIEETDDNSHNNRNNCVEYTQSPNTYINTNTNLIQDVLFVQTVLHPSLSNYSYDYTNGFNWVPPATSNVVSGNMNWESVAGVFGSGSGGGSSSW